MTWINTESERPPPDTDVLGLWWLGDPEMHVICLSSDGKWYRQCDDWMPPDSWMPLPAWPERPAKWRLPSEGASE